VTRPFDVSPLAAFLTLVLLGAACDSGAPAVVPQPTPAPAPPADARSVDVAAPIDADLSYPNDWITHALAENRQRACQQLVYKDGCRSLRTGRVALDVTLDEQGNVAAVRTNSVEISLEPQIVERCLLREVAKWKFHAPEDRARQLVLTVMFADKC
jgi:hypothetical protein